MAYEVGCLKCGKGGVWKVFTNGKEVVAFVCSNCNHQVNAKPSVVVELKEAPEISEAIESRFLT